MYSGIMGEMSVSKTAILAELAGELNTNAR
jgi:hypothetical protein